ncbi:hypothetical protein NW801_04110 [Brevibacillus laterosporus]|uniref:S1 motif domain-containing protein n=1 Tax=Brevibacillus halotolerans TaxID=1507437 RepID=A0ABT4HT64_9BACL|nr:MULTISPECIES: hypothetical protein [Brevibacillus]MCR8984265.1 hypothetical protein [Brevibacillus laterosporus]MCZ0829988.1 hypothetical protein [Brevibacillus halotolerans]
MIYLSACPEPGMGNWYFETDQKGIAYRQIIIQEDGSWITSHRKHEQFHYMLAEHPLDLDDTYYEKIPKAKFEELWSRFLQSTMDDWNQIKRSLPIGTKVEGEIEAFFPQGTLVNLVEEQATGLADTTSLRKATPPEWMYPGHKMVAIVNGYDEMNQWVVLDQARIFEDKRR